MSGFSGGNGAMGDLIRNVQSQQQGQRAQMGQTPATAPPGGGVGPGEPTQGGAYGQQGMYNTLATDMSRGRMGNYGFNGGMFGYQPFGNPYQQQSFGGMFGRGGYGGGWGGPPPPIMGGQQGHGGFLNSMYQQIGHPGLRNRMQNAQNAYGGMMGGSPDYSEGSYNAVPQMMGNHQYTGGMGGYGKPQPMGGGFSGGFGRRAMY